MPTLISRNPATGETIQELEKTPLEALPEIFSRAQAAQQHWNALGTKKRSEYLLQLRETLIDHADSLIELITRENGKPPFEAMANEIIPSADILTYFAKKAPSLLSDHSIPLRLMKHRKSYLNYWPVGVVAVISPWNYPFLLPFADIIMALVTGNAVIFKPSEITPCTGLRIQEICNEAGLPPFVLQTLVGDGSLGAALIQQRPGKIFFTGSVATGKKVMASAAQHLVPVNLELGGKDAMIILPDADLDYATSAALWGTYSNSGQVCASVERILVHERISEAFLHLFKTKIANLRQGPSAKNQNDLGPITFEKQKDIYTSQLLEAKEKGAELHVGGEFSSDRRFLKPTLIAGATIEQTQIYQEETFGPVAAVSTFKSISEAIQKANQSKYGLLASIITKNIQLAETIAKQLAVGTVTINEVVYTAGLGETPWGGVKESGFGRTHGEVGLYEFVNLRHIHKPRVGFLTLKSPWWFPYTPYQYSTFRLLLNLYRKSWFERLKTFPHFLWHFIQFVKTEKRL
jgi:succinate-semialdehyde dehydrogenase/glutarate-semialdehyde dehydrogenase